MYNGNAKTELKASVLKFCGFAESSATVGADNQGAFMCRRGCSNQSHFQWVNDFPGVTELSVGR